MGPSSNSLFLGDTFVFGGVPSGKRSHSWQLNIPISNRKCIGSIRVHFPASYVANKDFTILGGAAQTSEIHGVIYIYMCVWKLGGPFLNLGTRASARTKRLQSYQLMLLRP